MYQIISKEDIFQSILNSKDVFIVKPAEEKCVWANPLTVSDIMSMADGDFVVFTKEEDKRTGYSEVHTKYVDTIKFTEMLHAKNIRQSELARLAGVSAWTINSYVYHKNKPRKKTLEKVCSVLKCDPSDILEG